MGPESHHRVSDLSVSSSLLENWTYHLPQCHGCRVSSHPISSALLCQYRNAFRAQANAHGSLCRLRHVKCDEVRPVCGRCLKRGVVCHFDRNPAVRHVALDSLRRRDAGSFISPIPVASGGLTSMQYDWIESFRTCEPLFHPYELTSIASSFGGLFLPNDNTDTISQFKSFCMPFPLTHCPRLRTWKSSGRWFGCRITPWRAAYASP